MIDLDDERHAEPVSAEYGDVPRRTGRERDADRDEQPVESGRHGLFHRRH